MKISELLYISEQPMQQSKPIQGKITKVAGDNVEISDPKKPGVTTKVDLKKMDIDTSNPNKPTLKPKKPAQKGANHKIRPGQNVSITTETNKKYNNFNRNWVNWNTGE